MKKYGITTLILSIMTFLNWIGVYYLGINNDMIVPMSFILTSLSISFLIVFIAKIIADKVHKSVSAKKIFSIVSGCQILIFFAICCTIMFKDFGILNGLLYGLFFGIAFLSIAPIHLVWIIVNIILIIKEKRKLKNINN